MTRYCVMSMDYGKSCFVWDKKFQEPVGGQFMTSSWEQAARDAAKMNEVLEKVEKGKRY